MNSSPQPLVSVVTPVYNGAAYLAECIESVLRQTYENWEYVISDNRSTDASLEIAREYARRDSRVIVHAHTEHLPHHLASWNRAMALISPAGVYCKVVHADDWLFPECIEQMVRFAEAHSGVGVVGAYRLDETEVNLDGLPHTRPVVPGRELCRALLLGGHPYVFGSPTSTLIRSSLIAKRQPFYNESNIHADSEACYDVLQESDYGFVPQVLTYTRRHNESVTSFTQRVWSYLPEEIGVLMRWGPVYLSDQEYERKLLVRLLGYAAFLAKRPRRFVRDRDFRTFHLRKIREIMTGIETGQIARGATLQLRRTMRRRKTIGAAPHPSGSKSP